MRPDGKAEGLRQSMSWLHTWSGLLLGWLLYAVFFTGTLSYFVDEINNWMRPELHQSIPNDETADLAIKAMAHIAPGASTWTLNMPGERQTAVEASWRMPGAGPGRGGAQRVYLDAATGEKLEPRETRGGSFLYRFHFELYAMPRVWGRWIVGVATMFMLVAIISGVITHKKIFTEFFTFRPRKGQRSWLDAHNATAVLALPFHLVITFSGLLLLMFMLMPSGVHAVYQGDTQQFFAESRGGRGSGAQDREGGGRAGRTQDIANGTLTPIGPLMQIAQARWPERGVGSIVVQQPGSSHSTIELREQGGRGLSRGGGESLVFDGQTGEAKTAQPPRKQSAAQMVSGAMTGVHMGRFADPSVRWLLFLSGVIGTVMAGSGMVLWVVKRQPERRKLGKTPWGHRLVEVLNVSAIAGLSVATATYFWANRLVPVGLEGRADVEISCFFWAWGACLLHAVLRPHRQSWLEQLSLAALAFASLPLLNAATGGVSLPVALVQNQWNIAGFDLVMLCLAALHGYAAWKVRSPKLAAVGSGKEKGGHLPGTVVRATELQS